MNEDSTKTVTTALPDAQILPKGEIVSTTMKVTGPLSDLKVTGCSVVIAVDPMAESVKASGLSVNDATDVAAPLSQNAVSSQGNASLVRVEVPVTPTDIFSTDIPSCPLTNGR